MVRTECLLSNFQINSQLRKGAYKLLGEPTVTGTVDMIFTSRQLQEKSREQNKALFMAFSDLRKAFDTLNRETLYEVLRIPGCLPKYANVVIQFQEGMNARVTVGTQESAPFAAGSGIRQWCVMFPVLFNIYLVCVTTLFHRIVQERRVITIDFRLDGSHFNIRKFQA